MTNTHLQKQPSGLDTLFFVELWERFGFYAVQALLVLFLSQVYHWPDDQAYALFGAFSGLIYATPVIGGYLADRLLGFRRSILLGNVLYIIGYFTLATGQRSLFYAGLAFLICGNGFFKSSVSSLLGALYKKNDSRRDAGFTIFYMGINIGSFLSPIICSWIATHIGWGYGFAAAGVGMLICITLGLTGFKRLGDHGLAPDTPHLTEFVLWKFTPLWLVYIGVLASIAVIAVLVQYAQLTNYFLNLFSLATVIFLAVLTFRYDREQRNKMWALIILIAFSIVFWAFYAQTFSSLTLFTERVVDRNFFGWVIPTAMFQAVNPFVIITCSPLLAMVWKYIDGTQWRFSTPAKFSLALLLMGLSFFALVLGVNITGIGHLVGKEWLVISYVLQTLGELCLSPIGLSMVTALAPANLTGLVMGVWFLSSAIGFVLASYLANLTAIPSNITSISQISSIYNHQFNRFAWMTLAVGGLLMLLTPWLKRLIKASKTAH